MPEEHGVASSLPAEAPAQAGILASGTNIKLSDFLPCRQAGCPPDSTALCAAKSVGKIPESLILVLYFEDSANRFRRLRRRKEPATERERSEREALTFPLWCP